MSTAAAVAACRGCGSADLSTVLDLGHQPACDYFPPAADPTDDPRWPLALVLCGGCALLQLSHVSPAPEEPLAVESATLKRHAAEVSRRLLDRLGAGVGTSVREFSSHHGGSWREALREAGCHEVDAGAQLVIDNHSIIHAEELEADLAERVGALAPDGALVIEFHHALAQLQDRQFDTVRHGHPLYFSLHSWQAACRRHGLSIVDAWPEDVFGGCLVVVARPGVHPMSREASDLLAAEQTAQLSTPTPYVELANSVTTVTRGLRDHLQAARSAGRRVVGYGAGSKACTLLGAADIGPGLMETVADLAPGKHGRRVPGVGIPICSPQELIAADPDEVVVLTWDIASEVMAQLRAAGLTNARFVVPLPTLRYLD